MDNVYVQRGTPNALTHNPESEAKDNRRHHKVEVASQVVCSHLTLEPEQFKVEVGCGRKT